MAHEKITFHFEGSLADEHSLNFYEAARFQYATARLLVKLSQFRATGRFGKKITDKGNTDIILKTHQKGSFDISVLAPILMEIKDPFISVSITQLLSYVFERVVGTTKETDIIKVLNSLEVVTAQFGKISSDNTEMMGKALALVMSQSETISKLNEQQRDLYERLLSEKDRAFELLKSTSQLEKIDPEESSKLLGMASPLVREMGTALRRSATSLNVFSETGDSGSKNILFLNRKMAHEIETENIGEDVRLLNGNIVQYNKETGWGKLRFLGNSNLISFVIPSDQKKKIQKFLLSAMRSDDVAIAFRDVTNKSGEIIRVIIVNVLPSVAG